MQFQQNLRADNAIWNSGLESWATTLAEIGDLVGSGPNRELNGSAWNTAKTLFMDRILPIVNTGLNACSWIDFHLDSYAAYEWPLTEKATYLNEDTLRATIVMLQLAIIAAEAASVASGLFHPRRPPVDNSGAIAQWRAQIDQMQDSINQLVLFSQQTSGMFDSEVSLSQTMSNAVTSVGHGTLSSAGVYVPSAGDAETWLQGLLAYDATHPRNPQPVFSDIPGEYGGNQSSLSQKWESMTPSDQQSIINIILGYYPNLAGDDFKNVIGQMTKSGCGYIADVNSIMQHFANDPAGFQNKFGFPMYSPDGTVDFDLLFVDYWCFVQSSRGTDPTGNTKNNAPSGIFPTGDGYLKSFLQGHDVAITTQTKDWPTLADFDRIGHTADTVTISCDPTILYSMNGGTVPEQAVAGHAMVVTGQGNDPSGRPYLIVSSWGEQYKLYPDMYGPGKRYDTNGDGQYDAIDLNGDDKPDDTELYFTLEAITYG